MEAKALSVFVRRAYVAGIIDRPPALWWWNRARREGPGTAAPAPAPPADEELERDDDQPAGRDFAGFFSDASDEAVTRSVWRMVEKRRNRERACEGDDATPSGSASSGRSVTLPSPVGSGEGRGPTTEEGGP